MDRGLDDAQERLHGWVASVSQGAVAAAELSDRVAGLVASAETLDGAVRVRVDGAGRLIALELGEAVRQLAAAELAQAVMRAVALAQHDLNGQVARAVAATVGAESDAGRAVVDSFGRQYPDPGPAGGGDRSDRRCPRDGGDLPGVVGRG